MSRHNGTVLTPKRIKPPAGGAPLQLAPRPAVDYPAQGEKIAGPQYTLRVCAPPAAGSVEVSVDHGDWQPCRSSVGYWWFDWAGYEPGEHELIARARTLDGTLLLSEPSQCFVEPAPTGR